jgi:hypothetical protein
MSTASGVDPYLKAVLPTRILKRRGQSLHRRAPRSSPLRHGGWVPHDMQADPETEGAKPLHTKQVTTTRL